MRIKVLFKNPYIVYCCEIGYYIINGPLAQSVRATDS